MIRRTAILVLGLSVIMLGGCLAVGGSRTSTAVQPTTGQELIDLKRALDCGAITQAEFESERASFLSCSG